MNYQLLFCLLFIAQNAWASSPEPFFSSLGSYQPSKGVSLTLAATDSGAVELTLKGEAATPGDKGVAYTPSSSYTTACSLEKPYFFFFDIKTQTLWWTGPTQIGYIDYQDPSSTKSRTFSFTQGVKEAGMPEVALARAKEMFPEQFK